MSSGSGETRLPGRARLPDEADLPDQVTGRRWREIAAVFVGGVFGTLARDGVERGLPTAAGTGWPTATFLINIAGAFALGLLLESLALRGGDNERRRLLRLGLGTGVLGGFTTMSTLAVEASLLGRADHWSIAVGYPLASVVAGLLLAWLGVAAARVAGRR